MNQIKKIFSDYIGIMQICGALISARWAFSIVTSIPAIHLKKDLQPADHKMGKGPFNISLSYGARFKVAGEGVFSGIREMYVRDVYLRDGTLSIRDDDVVVDLGANIGNFTNMALASGENVNVVAIEPSARLNECFLQSVGLNQGFTERVTLIRAFVGHMGDLQKKLKNGTEDYDAPWLSENQLIETTGLKKINFLKCDIEGGEYELLNGKGVLLDMTQQLAIEIHAFAGDVKLFMDGLKKKGFTVLSVQWDPDGSCTALAKRL